MSNLYFRTVRRWTASLRALPDYVIIGAQKGGTTALHAYIQQHPQTRSASVKEVHYFDHFYERGNRWYMSHFPMRRTLRAGQAITGEATPSYMFPPQVAERMHALLPHVKLIAILRNPAERAISQYAMSVARGVETETLDVALQLEADRTEAALALMQSSPLEGIRALARCAYRGRGLYADQLGRFLTYFPREQLLVLKSEDLRADPPRTLRKVFLHLGLASDFVPPDLTFRHVRRNSVSVAPEIGESLAAFFRPHNARLSALLGDDSCGEVHGCSVLPRGALAREMTCHSAEDHPVRRLRWTLVHEVTRPHLHPTQMHRVSAKLQGPPPGAAQQARAMTQWIAP
jgi:hypothetical protein